MLSEDMESRLAALDAAVREGRIIRNAWHRTDEDGRELVCLLAAYAPEVINGPRLENCPAEACPRWWAEITPSLDDRVFIEDWPEIVAAYPAALRQLLSLPEERQQRCADACSAVAVREARSHSSDERVLALCSRVIALCDAGRSVASETAWAALLEEVDQVQRSGQYDLVPGADGVRGPLLEEQILDLLAVVLERFHDPLSRLIRAGWVAETAGNAAGVQSGLAKAWSRLARAMYAAIHAEAARAAS